MLIDAATLARIFSVQPTGILHVGAHEGEELALYAAAGWLARGRVIWVEAQPALARTLRQRLAGTDAKVIHAVAWDVDGAPLELKIASNSQSTSVFEFGTHAASYPEITFTERSGVIGRRLDHLLAADDRFDFVALDIQGAELAALRGLGARLSGVSWIYTECQRWRVYKDAPDLAELDEFLAERGFVRVAARWAGRHGWGDALYSRVELVSALSVWARACQSAQFALFQLSTAARERRQGLAAWLNRRMRPRSKRTTDAR